ncbi:hypothetical protein [Arsukibacterium sp. MJ3]|uniref:hypothetical protein n=1 Tax=Arsukibacterium sp. MJ3 TaxID=1632859 RepID=UPI0013792495|nr:hypothetical protein [Arsukibacterium sp. MJ3]
MDMDMDIGSVVRFNDERFFEGAVQLGWLQKRPEQAQKAAESFVFHGPRYHGASSALSDGIDGEYQLKDTASFVQDLLGSILKTSSGIENNPYWLVVAGYGSGKSHLALACAELLSNPKSLTAKKVISQLSSADGVIGARIEEQLTELDKPALILPLDGMSGFHLGNALSQAVFKQLAIHNIDSEPLRKLSPRFDVACKFVERNFIIRLDRFNKLLPDLTEDEICLRLRESDEFIYELVDSIYSEANGQPIPIEGQESSQELIETLCNLYCGKEGPFSQVIIMFDEFGRYLEYASDKPHLAGDAALQQIFQGIQDNSDKIQFIGFIQYELKTYLKRFSGAGLRHLQRYITRFDTAKKWYLSTNLETIFAHMIHKDEAKLDAALFKANAKRCFEDTHSNLSICLPSFSRYPVWQDRERFAEVIGRGCWPLHPLAVWFLTRQKDVVQSRSALTFIRDTISRVSSESIIENNVIKQVSAAELVLGSMLSELVAAEREVGGAIAETLQALLEKFSGHLDKSTQLVLAGVAALEKMRVGKQKQDFANVLLNEATGLTDDNLLTALGTLAELGALEWNKELGQYELLSDGASRGQFQQWLRKQQLAIKSNDKRNLFMRRAASEGVLESIETDFGSVNNISTQDWFFEASYAHAGNISNAIKQAFKDWSESYLPTDAKGKVIYLYIDSAESKLSIEQEIQSTFTELLVRYQLEIAPILVIGLEDKDTSLIDSLSRLYLLEELLTDADKERFRRFIPDELQRSQAGSTNALKNLIKQNDFWAAGFKELPAGRLKKIGEAIFSTIYTKALPFYFDGFANRNAGGGNPDSAALMRGLICKQVDAVWIQSQPVRLRNRVHTLMSQSWKAISPSGKLIVPQESSVKYAFSILLEAHQKNTSKTLIDSYQTLIRPPFGMNSASAGLLISLLIGLDVPPRRLEYKKELISSVDWINLIFLKKSNHFNEESLAATTLRFLTESGDSKWRDLFNHFELETKYEEIINLVNKVVNLNKVEPYPESLEGTFRYWLDLGSKINEKVNAKQSELNKYEEDLERLGANLNVNKMLSLSYNLLKAFDDMDASELWPVKLLSECEEHLKYSKDLLSNNLDSWIPRQTCNSLTNVSDFRKQMEFNTRALESLGYTKYSEALRKQTTSSIHRVEKLQEYQLTLAQCADYPRQPSPNASTRVRTLRDDYARGDQLISTMQSASATFTSEEINAHVAIISARQKVLKNAELEKREELGLLYNAPQSEQELNDILQKAEHLQKVFSDTRDENEIKDIIFQIKFILNDIRGWTEREISVTRLQELLIAQSFEHERNYIEQLEAKGTEPVWSEDIYKMVALERIDRVKQRSKTWVDARYLSPSEVLTLDAQRTQMLKTELEFAPTFLSDEHSEKLNDMLHMVKKHLFNLEEEKRSLDVQVWLAQFQKLDNIAALEPQTVLRYLALISKPPHILNDSESHVTSEIEQLLQERSDRVSVDGIMKRIEQLPRNMQQDIHTSLEKVLNQKVVL